MKIQDIIEGKKAWRAHMARVKSLPPDYQIVYREIQKYLYKIGPVELSDGIGLLSELVGFFEEGTAMGKRVLEVTGNDVAAFCDELVKDSVTYSDLCQGSVDVAESDAMKKAMDKKSREGMQL